MTLRSAAIELLEHTRETRFEDLKEVPTAYVKNLRNALVEEANEQKEVKKDA